jgi:hypothetical protein
MKPFIIFALLWLIFAAIGAAIGNLLLDTSGLEDFTAKGVSIYGKVTAKEPENHQTVRYVYEVNGKQYEGAGGAERGNPPFDEIQIGQKVVVFYKPENPEKAILGYPQLYVDTNYNGALFFSIAFSAFIMVPVVLIYVLYRKTKKIA